MIERYSLPEMKNIWTLKNKFAKWLKVEIAVCEAMNKLQIIPDKDLKNIKEKAKYDIEEILSIENQTHHDVIAFLTNVAQYVGESSRFIHKGLTSSDIIDTANALLMKEAGSILIEDLRKLLNVLKARAMEHKYTLCIGRTHGVHAEPITFGLKLALWYEEIKRDIERMQKAVKTISVGKISGAVGNYAYVDPFVEEYVCKTLGLEKANISTQIIQRDRHSEFLSTIAIVGATIEKIAMEIRSLQRTEIREVEEHFGKRQKGSSAMPHKKNPIISERLCGMARILRSNLMAGMENNALWNERDISHSSVERVIIPDSTILLDYMLNKATDLIENLLVYPENMKKNIDLTYGLIFSQSVLLKLTEKGITREDAYKIVQRNAMKCWEERKTFRFFIEQDKEVCKYLSQQEIDGCFKMDKFTDNVDYIFQNVFGDK